MIRMVILNYIKFENNGTMTTKHGSKRILV